MTGKNSKNRERNKSVPDQICVSGFMAARRANFAAPQNL